MTDEFRAKFRVQVVDNNIVVTLPGYSYSADLCVKKLDVSF
jgi:hypothetical protein